LSERPDVIEIASDPKLDAGHPARGVNIPRRNTGLGAPALDQQFLRAIFNIIARNQDDHVRNIAFLTASKRVEAFAGI
jgi:hypothetical protein